MYIVEQLHCPLSDSDLPRLIVVSKRPESWRRLWNCREGLRDKTQLWFERLEDSGAVPIVGSSIEVSTLNGAEGVQRFLTERAARMADTWPELPEWFYGSAWWQAGSRSAKAVVRRLPDGSVEEHRSIRCAARAVNSNRHTVRRWIRTGVRCPDGSIWTWLS